MDRTEVRLTVTEIFRKYRWAALVLAMGLCLMLFPDQQESPQVPVVQEIQQEQSMQQELEDLLSKLDGAGKVKVLLSIRTGERYHYQLDEDLQKNDNTSDQRRETVIITSKERDEHGLLQRTDPPVYMGAVIICQGADSAKVRLAVVDAVSTITGLGADQISVLKMK